MIEILSYILLLASLPLLLFRSIKGPKWTDRILAADLFTVYLIAGLLLFKQETRWSWDRDVIWLFFAIGLVSFISVGLLMEESDG